jgi:hypothetical protein
VQYSNHEQTGMHQNTNIEIMLVIARCEKDNINIKLKIFKQFHENVKRILLEK